jgi:hypothetical protein
MGLQPIAGDDAHQMTWCCIQKLRINHGEGQYREGGYTSGRESAYDYVGNGITPERTGRVSPPSASLARMKAAKPWMP